MAADVIMLNLWAHDVGRADGQAYSVLRSVFEEAVRLYGGQNGGDDGDAAESLARRDGAPVGGPARFPKVWRGNGGGAGCACVVVLRVGMILLGAMFRVRRVRDLRVVVRGLVGLGVVTLLGFSQGVRTGGGVVECCLDLARHRGDPGSDLLRCI